MNDQVVTRMDVDRALGVVKEWKAAARARGRSKAEKKLELIERVIRGLLI